MSPIKDFELTFEAANPAGSYSEGDAVAGTLRFTLTKDTKVKNLFVKMKGEAKVSWSEGSGDDEKHYSDHRRFFKEKQHFVAEGSTVLPKGVHCFEFSLKIPHGSFPSSFSGVHGKIVYVLQAKLCRSWRFPTGPDVELKFVSNSVPLTTQALCPQAGTVEKSLGVFSKGDVNLSATINRKACCPGETLSIVARVKNSSSKSMKPKFSLNEQAMYRAGSNATVSDKCLCKVVGEPIEANSEQSVTCQMMIPEYVTCTIENCEILTVSYYLKVYLDISFAADPEVVFPLVIVPLRFAAQLQSEDFMLHPPGAVGGPSHSDFPAPALPYGPPAPAGPLPYGPPVPAGPLPYGPPAPAGPLPYGPPAPAGPLPYGPPAPAGPVPYGYPAPYPAPGANVPGGFSYPQQAPPYGAPAAAFPPPTVQPSAPCAPPMPQQDPPPYNVLYVLDGRSEPEYVLPDTKKSPS